MTEQQQLPRIYTLQQIEDAIQASPSFEQDLIQAVEDAFASYTSFNAAPIQTLGAPPMQPFQVCENYAAQTCIKSGYTTGDEHFCIKVASGGHPMPSNTGLLQVYSQATGRLETLLLDQGVLTEHRTAAAGAWAAKYLAPKQINKIGILGTGVQARYQLRYLKWVTSCRNVLVWGRTVAHTQKFQDEMTAQGWKVEIAAVPSDLLDQCDLIVTVTSAREPLLTASSSFTANKRAQHITCIGADAPGKMELDPKLVASAGLLTCDSVLQTIERGEFQHAIAAGLVQSGDVYPLAGLLIQAADLLRLDDPDEEDNRLTIFDTSGVAAQDCAVAKLASKLLATSNANT